MCGMLCDVLLYSNDGICAMKYLYIGSIYYELGDIDKTVDNMEYYHELSEDSNFKCLCFVVIREKDVVKSDYYLGKMKSELECDDESNVWIDKELGCMVISCWIREIRDEVKTSVLCPMEL